MYLTHKDPFVTDRSQSKELSLFGSRIGYGQELGKQIWQGSHAELVERGQATVSGWANTDQELCWSVAGRPSASTLLLHDTVILVHAWYSNLAVKQRPILHGIGFLGPGNQTAGGIDLVPFQFYMILWLTKQNDCIENNLCFHIKIRLERQNNSSSPIPQIKHGCYRYIRHQQVTAAKGLWSLNFWSSN